MNVFEIRLAGVQVANALCPGTYEEMLAQLDEARKQVDYLFERLDFGDGKSSSRTASS